MLRKTCSGIMLTLLLIGMLMFAFNIQPVKASGSIYIRADGSIDPPDAPISTVDNVTYTLTGNITSDADGIVVERSNIIIDGGGYTLQGTGADESKGIYLFGMNNVTIKNANIKWFYDGVYLHHSSFISLFGNNITLGKGSWHCAVLLVSSCNNKISRNNIISPWTHGVRLESSCGNIISENMVTNTHSGIQITSSSDNNTIYGNYVTNNEYAGILLSWSSNNTIFGNAINNSKYNFGVEGAFLSHFIHSIDTSNLVNGKPIYYLVNKNDLVINLTTYQNIGYLALVNCTNVTVKDLNLTNNAQGLLLVNTNNSNIINSSITSNYNGIQLFSSSHNNILKSNVVDNVNGIVLQVSSNYNNVSGNKITKNAWGVYFGSSSYSNIFGNKIEANTNGGILLEYSSNNSIAGNNMEANGYGGICLSDSANNHIAGNSIAGNNLYGIRLSEHSSENSITGNNITNNEYGIWLYPWFNDMNVFSGNNIANNMRGIGLCWSSWNIFFRNIVTNNNVGIYFYSSPFSDNKFYHNNFINNILQVQFETSDDVNFWDDGYPSGGNFWSDYIDGYPAGVDSFSGPYQNVTGSDGIGDTPYVIDANNRDNYPFMNTTLLVPWIADPSNGTWVSGNAEIAAIEYDFSSIAGASFEYSKNALDWRLIGVDNNGTDGTYNAQWNTSLVAEGWYYLRVTMHDASGHFGQSAIQVYVDPTPPVPTITQPSDNSEIASCPTQLEATTQARDIAGVVFAYHNASNPDFIKDSLPILKQPDEYSCRPTAEAASFLWLAQKSTGDPNLVTQEMKDDTSILIYDLRTKMGTKGTIESGPENKTGTTNEKAQVGIYKYLEEYYARMTKANEVDPKKNPAPVVFKEHTDMTEDWPNFNWFSIYRNHLPSDDVILSLRIEEWDWVNNKPILDPKTGKPKATYHSVAGMGYDILKWVGGPQHGKPRTDQGGVYFMDPSVGQTYGTMLKNGEIMNYQDSKGHYLLQGKRIFLNAISTLTPRKDLSTKQLKKIEDPYGWTVIGVDTDGLNGWTTTWDTSALPLGPYLLLAVMVDSAGNAASDIIWVELRGAWPMFHNYLTHTGYSTSTAPNTNQTVWNYATGSYVTSSPAVVDGVVFVGSGDNNVYALNAMTGTQVWNYTTSSPVNWASPAVAGGVVYVGSNDGKVYALNATTGTKMWDYTTSGAVYSSPAVVGGVVYEGSTDGKVYALNATTGTQVWSYTTDSEVWSSPAVAGGVVYVGSNDGKVYALNATTGTKMWDYTTSGAVYSSPAVDGGVVFVGSCNNNTYALNASTGAFIWSYKTNSYVYSSPAVAAGKVYVGSGNIFEGLGNGKIYCLNASSGAFIWNYTTGGWVSSSAAVAGGVVYVGSFDGKVYALDATTGAQVWSYRTGGWVFSSPAVVNWIVYVGSLDGKIYALGGVHDVAVTNVASSKTVVGQGYSASINVIVSNQGSYTETFNVTARADGVGVNDGLVGYWSFDEGRGTTAHDTSGNLNDGTIYGANWTDGKFGKALSFDGIDDYVAVPGSPSLNNISDAVTIAAWVKLEQVPTEAYELISAGGYSYVAYAYVADPAGVRFNFGRVTAPGVGDDLQQEFWKQYGATLPYLPYNQWYHVVWMYDSSGYAAIYVNGKPYANTTLMSGKIYSFGGSLTIDARNLHKGILDEVRIYNRTLSQQEIRAVAGSGAIQTQTVSLTSGDSTTITFTWNTTGFAKGNYTLWSYAEPVQGETFTFDNSFTDGWVLISIHCDINSDGIVDISDILDTALAFGSTPGHPLWNPNCDLDNNGIVDISDILEVALHYGETDP